MRKGPVVGKGEFGGESSEGVMWVGPSHLTSDLSSVPSEQTFCSTDIT